MVDQNMNRKTTGALLITTLDILRLIISRRSQQVQSLKGWIGPSPNHMLYQTYFSQVIMDLHLRHKSLRI